MKLSIIFITKRPGGLDILLNTLHQQSFKNFELIIVDDIDCTKFDNLFEERRKFANEEAKKLNIDLVYYDKSFRHTYHNPKYRINSALNDGLLFIKDKYKDQKYDDNVVVFLHDYIWINHRSLEIINQMYSRAKDKNFLLSFPEVFVEVPHDQLTEYNSCNKNNKSLNINTLFNDPLKTSPALLKWNILKELQPCPASPQEVYNILNFTKFNNSPITNSVSVEYDFWEHYFSAIPYNLIAKVNGFDERLDAGPNSITTEKYNTLMAHEKEEYDSREPQGFNDYGEKSVWRVCQYKLQSKCILIVSLPVLKLDNAKFAAGDNIRHSKEWLWKRNPKDTGMHYGASILQDRLNNNIIRSPNHFSL